MLHQISRQSICVCEENCYSLNCNKSYDFVKLSELCLAKAAKIIGEIFTNFFKIFIFEDYLLKFFSRKCFKIKFVQFIRAIIIVPLQSIFKLRKHSITIMIRLSRALRSGIVWWEFPVYRNDSVSSLVVVVVSRSSSAQFNWFDAKWLTDCYRECLICNRNFPVSPLDVFCIVKTASGTKWILISFICIDSINMKLALHSSYYNHVNMNEFSIMHFPCFDFLSFLSPYNNLNFSSKKWAAFIQNKIDKNRFFFLSNGFPFDIVFFVLLIGIRDCENTQK